MEKANPFLPFLGLFVTANQRLKRPTFFSLPMQVSPLSVLVHQPLATNFMSQEDMARRGPWTLEEDHQLLRLVDRFGASSWVRISSHLQTRTPKQCRERYHQNLKPSLNKAPITEDEGRLIEDLVSKIGTKWAEIARVLDNGRSDNAVKNWWNGGANKRKRAAVATSQSVNDQHLHHLQQQQQQQHPNPEIIASANHPYSVYVGATSAVAGGSHSCSSPPASGPAPAPPVPASAPPAPPSVPMNIHPMQPLPAVNTAISPLHQRQLLHYSSTTSATPLWDNALAHVLPPLRIMAPTQQQATTNAIINLSSSSSSSSINTNANVPLFPVPTPPHLRRPSYTCVNTRNCCSAAIQPPPRRNSNAIDVPCSSSTSGSASRRSSAAFLDSIGPNKRHNSSQVNSPSPFAAPHCLNNNTSSIPSSSGGSTNGSDLMNLTSSSSLSSGVGSRWNVSPITQSHTPLFKSDFAFKETTPSVSSKPMHNLAPVVKSCSLPKSSGSEKNDCFKLEYLLNKQDEGQETKEIPSTFTAKDGCAFSVDKEGPKAKLDPACLAHTCFPSNGTSHTNTNLPVVATDQTSPALSNFSLGSGEVETPTGKNNCQPRETAAVLDSTRFDNEEKPGLIIGVAASVPGDQLGND